MRPKVSVVTVTYRPGYIDSCVAALKAQTLRDFEWILVDDLTELRKDLVKDVIAGDFPVTHVVPKVISPFAATGAAVNTGIVLCRGELIHFMNDYMYLHPRTLERHWGIYQKYGPKILISGRLIDYFTAQNKSVASPDVGPLAAVVNIGDEPVRYWEASPPIEWPLKPNFLEPSSENLVSIFRAPFVPTWPTHRLPDWRAWHSSHLRVEEDLFENLIRDREITWWWAGKCDSAPLAALQAAHGMDEVPGRHGGLETDLFLRLTEWGCHHLIDWECPSYMLPHPSRKREAGWEDFTRVFEEGTVRQVREMP